MKIYFAGPLFTAAERRFNDFVCSDLRSYGFEVFNPQEQEVRMEEPDWARKVFNTDVEGIDWADVVVANLDGPDPDSGTCWEMGYAYAKGKPIYWYRTDFRGAGEGSGIPVNIMMWGSAKQIVLPVMPTAMVVASAISKELNHARTDLLSN